MPIEKHTERTMLDMLNKRYQQNAGNGERWVQAEHPRNGTGFGGWNPDTQKNNGPLRTADFLAIDGWESQGYRIIGHEVKVSRSDWLTELRDPSKAEAWARYCHRWYVVVPNMDIVRRDEVPAGWGVLVARGARLVTVVQSGKRTPEPMPLAVQIGLMRAVAKTAEARGRSTERREAELWSAASGEATR